MKYKKLLKKAAVSLLLAQSLIFTGLPIQAADIAGQSMVWTESVENGKRRRRCISCVVGCDDCGRVLCAG